MKIERFAKEAITPKKRWMRLAARDKMKIRPRNGTEPTKRSKMGPIPYKINNNNL